MVNLKQTQQQQHGRTKPQKTWLISLDIRWKKSCFFLKKVTLTEVANYKSDINVWDDTFCNAFHVCSQNISTVYFIAGNRILNVKTFDAV